MALTKVTYGLISADTSAIDLNIDQNTLYVETSGNRVGIGTTAPSTKLDVVGGTIRSTGDVGVAVDTGTNAYMVIDRSASNRRGALVFSTAAADVTASPPANATLDWALGVTDSDEVSGDKFYIHTDTNSSNARFVIDGSNGNVGIGTTSPSVSFEVRSTSQAVARIRSDAGSITDIGSDATGTYFKNYTAASNTFRFIMDDSSESVRIDSLGRVGIGTTSPTKELDVLGTLRAVDGSSNNHQLRPTQLIAYNTNAIINAQSTGNDVLLRTQGNTRLIATAEGNVGIGTTNPASTLDVRGVTNIRVDGGNEQLVIKRDSSPNEQLLFGVHSSDYSYIQAVEQNVAFRPLALNPSGANVGIGTTSPDALLHLNDSGNTQLRLTTTQDSNTPTAQIAYSAGSGYFLRLGDSANNEDVMIRTYGDTVFNGGDVGIGTNTPQTRLSIVEGANYSAPTLGTASGNFSMMKYDSSAGGDYGLLMGVVNTGDVWQQVQRIDGGATAYNLLLQPSGGKVTIGTGTSSGTELLNLTSPSGTGAAMEFAGNNFTLGSTSMLVGHGSGGDGYVYQRANKSLIFGSNNTEVFRLRSAGDGIQFPDNNTFIATSNTAGGTAYEWGSIRRPASSDGGQLSIRQYSTGDTAANYPAYAGGRSGWDENTGMYFPNTDQVGLTAGGNSGLVCYASTDARGIEVQDCLSTRANTTSTRAREHFYHFVSQATFTYAHLKTNISWASATQMYSIKCRGHEYGASKPIDVALVWYNYSPSNAAVNIGSSGTHTATVYGSDDGYTVMRITFTSGYYTAFTVSQYPTAQGCALFNVTASAANSTASHY